MGTVGYCFNFPFQTMFSNQSLGLRHRKCSMFPGRSLREAEGCLQFLRLSMVSSLLRLAAKLRGRQSMCVRKGAHTHDRHPGAVASPRPCDVVGRTGAALGKPGFQSCPFIHQLSGTRDVCSGLTCTVTVSQASDEQDPFQL